MRRPADVGAAPRESPADPNPDALVQRWVEGKATLKDVRGYTDEELFAIARTAYVFFHQGRLEEARTLFQGLYAVNPVEAYFARALGVVEFAAGNPQGALAAWDVAIKLAPNDPSGWVGRAEVKIATGQKAQAIEDLRRAKAVAQPTHAVVPKVDALLRALSPR